MPVGVDDVRARRSAPAPRSSARCATILHDEGHATGQGDEGGFAPSLAVERGRGRGHPAGDREGRLPARRGRRDRARPGDEPSSSRRAPASTASPTATPRDARAGRSTPASSIDLWADWVARYPIVSIEDGLAEDDWAGWRELTARLGDTVQLVGDDLLVTNTERHRARRSSEDAANSVLIKLNQIGTLTETIDAIELARRRRLDRGRVAPLRRDRGHDDRRPRRRDGHRPDQDRRAVALASGSPSTTGCSGSRASSATARATSGRAALSGAAGRGTAPRRRPAVGSARRDPVRRPRRDHRRLCRDRHGGHDRRSASCWSSRSSRSTGCSRCRRGC